MVVAVTLKTNNILSTDNLSFFNLEEKVNWPNFLTRSFTMAESSRWQEVQTMFGNVTLDSMVMTVVGGEEANTLAFLPLVLVVACWLFVVELDEILWELRALKLVFVELTDAKDSDVEDCNIGN